MDDVRAVVLDPQSMLGRIGAELVRSLKLSEGEDYEEARETLRELLYGLRSAVHEPVEQIERSGHAGNVRPNIFQFSPDDFLRDIQERDEREGERLKLAYDHAWLHVPLVDVLQSGESRTKLVPLKLRANVEELEEVAHRYCSQRTFHSSMLEWVLIDSLMFGECLAFAETALSERRVFGFLIPEPLSGIGVGKLLKRGILLSIKQLVVGAIKLFVLAALATILSDGNRVVFWMILLAGLLMLYLKPRSSTDDVMVDARRLLFDMAAAHNLLRHFHFNARLLRHVLYNLESRGAVFSPFIYNILDRRIAREERECQAMA